MTIEELYIWSKENGYENYTIEVMRNDGDHFMLDLVDIEIDFNSIKL